MNRTFSQGVLFFMTEYKCGYETHTSKTISECFFEVCVSCPYINRVMKKGRWIVRKYQMCSDYLIICNCSKASDNDKIKLMYFYASANE